MTKKICNKRWSFWLPKGEKRMVCALPKGHEGYHEDKDGNSFEPAHITCPLCKGSGYVLETDKKIRRRIK